MKRAADGRDHELTVTGSPAQLHQAQQWLQDGSALKVELFFPARSMGRIIGQGGERIQEMGRSSGANIYCERRTENNQAALTQLVTVTGTREQVEAAKTLLQKASEEFVAVQGRVAQSSTFRSRRKEIIAVKKVDRRRPPEEEQDKQPPLWEAPQTMDPAEDRALGDESPAQENLADCPSNICKFEVPSPDFSFRADEYVDVYVSAAEKPEHFWIQILGSRSSQLDKLTTEMSDHYRGRKRGAVPEIQVGDIVAAPFHVDKFWYRAEVLGFLQNGNVDLYYVDYGNNWDTAREELHPLRSDFLSLPFQAIECGLSGVAPHGGTWSHQALDVFDTLSHCAEWKPLLAKISSFPSPGESCYFQIHLYDPSIDPMLDIGLELIRQGHAIECQVSPMKGDETDSLVARLLVGNVLTNDGSIEMIRVDVFRIPERQQQSGISTPTSWPNSVDEVDSLDQSVSKIGDHPATSSPSTALSPKNTAPSASSSDSSWVVSGSFSTCTSSEGLSFVPSSLEDSSINSPRGCFYYLNESSTSSSREVITISSDSEGDIVQMGVKRAPRDFGKDPQSDGGFKLPLKRWVFRFLLKDRKVVDNRMCWALNSRGWVIFGRSLGGD
ncbi:unnamed protein product [Ranitomeya imitator]|uniref:Tudor domain-containing protein n=1 Tax=Ranitomeya imitator TaxID=111125 RepID=A0ABN9KS91_9NEOB|nr:unnamed protein product [Ranitomeya imitator]